MIGIKLYTNVLLRTMRSKNFGRNRLRISRRQIFIEEANSMNDRKVKVKVKLLSRVRLFATPWTV